MVITRLNGGLGNQLFQYAAGKRLATILNTELRLDVSALGNPAYRSVRHYELGPFNIHDRFADAADVARFRPEKQAKIARFFYKREPRVPRGYVKEAHFHFDPAILSLSGDVYLDGYWQSERYFADAEATIRKALMITQKPDNSNQRMLNEISGCNAVSIHVRRGDYLKDQAVLQMHGVCSLDYYRQAVDFIASKVEAPVFFVFSDEPEWVRENLHLPYPMAVVDHNGVNRGYEDLRLMSTCRHHIIANSTFSWWGAWLNPSKDKIVVAPKRWFNDFDANTKDIYPDSWMQL